MEPSIERQLRRRHGGGVRCHAVVVAAFVAMMMSLLRACDAVVSTVVDGLPRLDDGTFERETQATSGSTTGSWFVMFMKGETSSRGGMTTKTRAALDATRECASALLERGVVAATVDVTQSPEVADRFRFVLKPPLPSFVLIKEGKAYARGWKEGDNGDALERFAIETYAEESDDGVPVPVQLTYIQRKFAKLTNVIAKKLFRTYRWSEIFMKTMTKDFEAAAKAFKSGGVREARFALGKALNASSTDYGILMLMCGVVSIIFAAALAIVTYPANRTGTNTKSKTE